MVKVRIGHDDVQFDTINKAFVSPSTLKPHNYSTLNEADADKTLAFPAADVLTAMIGLTSRSSSDLFVLEASVDSVAISSIADAGGGDITVTTGTDHGLAVGDVVTIEGTGDAAYNNRFIVLTTPTATTFTVTAAFTATDTGTVSKGNVLKYLGESGFFAWQLSGSFTGSDNITYEFSLSKNNSQVANTLSPRTAIGTGAIPNPIAASGIIELDKNDLIRIEANMTGADADAIITQMAFSIYGI